MADSTCSACATLFDSGRVAAQTSGTWTNTTSDGAWSSPANWSGGNIASGMGATADFSTLTLPAQTTVHLDSSYTVGSLVFGDQGNANDFSMSMVDISAAQLN